MDGMDEEEVCAGPLDVTIQLRRIKLKLMRRDLIAMPPCVVGLHADGTYDKSPFLPSQINFIKNLVSPPTIV